MIINNQKPTFFKTSEAIGTVELTGFEMMPISALGATSAAACAKSRTIDAFVLKRSSLVMPVTIKQTN